jgi:hypothetical protein
VGKGEDVVSDQEWRVVVSGSKGEPWVYNRYTSLVDAKFAATYLDNVNPFSDVTFTIEHYENDQWVEFRPCAYRVVGKNRIGNREQYIGCASLEEAKRIKAGMEDMAAKWWADEGVVFHIEHRPHDGTEWEEVKVDA